MPLRDAMLGAPYQPQSERAKALAAPGPTLDQRAYSMLGADPSLAYRGTILPMGRTADGSLTAAWPQFAVDMARSAALPRHAAEGGGFSVNDVTRMGLDVGMLGSVAPAPAGALRMGATMTDDAAQGVIRLTDDAAARLTPEERLRIAQHNAAQPVEAGGLGLQPDNTPQMRAQAMGFDTSAKLYHGSPDARGIKEEGFSTFQERATGSERQGPYFFTDNRSVAGTYANPHRAFDYQAAEPAVIDAFIKQNNPLVVNARGARFRGIDKSVVLDAMPDGPAKDNMRTALDRISNERISTDQLASLARRFNFDGVVVRNVVDDYMGKGKPANVYLAFGASSVRSPSAAFDPARSASANLLAANAPGAGSMPGLFALNQSYNEAQRRDRERVARETLARGGT